LLAEQSNQACCSEQGQKLIAAVTFDLSEGPSGFRARQQGNSSDAMMLRSIVVLRSRAACVRVASSSRHLSKAAAAAPQTVPDAEAAAAAVKARLAAVKLPEVKLEACGAVDDDDEGNTQVDYQIVFLKLYFFKVLTSACICSVHLYVFTADKEDEEQMFVLGPDGTQEWGGPTRGGRHAEPTRFGDWERKGRCSDF
jgi:Protein of unknown function (DUF1674)